jgi:hypothetical protein
MNIAPSGKKLSALAVSFLLLGLVPALSQQLDHGFMPKGGKTLLLELLGSPPSGKDIRAIVEARRSEPEWRQTVGPRAGGLSERELRTLTAYLATNMPVPDPESVAAKIAKPDDLAAALPRDGQELAWQECQFCHSLFTSHLTQARDMQAWLNMFQSPFHRELKMTEQERHEFSSYSAINMPMPIEDVPSDLRF